MFGTCLAFIITYIYILLVSSAIPSSWVALTIATVYDRDFPYPGRSTAEFGVQKRKNREQLHSSRKSN
jgi:hypothetical protein